jgi:hypothetical protein
MTVLNITGSHNIITICTDHGQAFQATKVGHNPPQLYWSSKTTEKIQHGSLIYKIYIYHNIVLNNAFEAWQCICYEKIYKNTISMYML